MQTLTIKVDNDYVEKILSLLNNLLKNKIEIVQAKPNYINVFGILKDTDTVK